MITDIKANASGLKVAVGSQAVLVADATGKVLVNKPAGTRPTMTIGPATHTMKTGTNAEVATAKLAEEVKFAAMEAEALEK